MLINSGRLLMTGVWLFLLWNLIDPFPKPLRYFLDVAFFSMMIMHGLQLMLISSAPFKSKASLERKDKFRLFIFGVFELLAWQKKLLLEEKK